jgi:hypothetical protein
MRMKAFRGLLIVLLVLVAVSTGGGEISSPVSPMYRSGINREVVGYAMHNGRLYEVVETVKISYHYKSINNGKRTSKK